MEHVNNTAAEARISRARTRMLLDFPWFGALSMRLRVEPAACPTMETNGTVLRYNPEFVLSLPEAQLVGVMAHEVMHCALLHPYRRNGRDNQRWNEACDYVINLELVAAGLELPADVLLDDQYKGLSAEVVYAQRTPKPEPEPEPEPEQDGDDDDQDGDDDQPGPDQPGPDGQGEGADGEGDGQGDQPLSTGTFTDAPAEQPAPDAAPGDQPMTAEDWKIATEQATRVASKAGKMPGGVDRAAKQSRETVEDWRAILREFIEHTTPSDYSWTNPNRRHISNGVYLPGTVRENLGEIAVAVDTSASIDADVLNAFAVELTAIVHEARPERVQVIYCDYSVQHTEEFTPDDADIKLNAKGGGGTRFQPVFDVLNDQDQPPVCLLYFTDLEGPAPIEPEYPVLWMTGLNITKDGPFGRTVRVDIHL